MRRARGDLAWVIGLTAVAAALRFVRISSMGFWFDEAVTGELLRLGVSDMLHHLPKAELTPPLYYLVAWPWERAFAHGEAAIRSFSAVLGTAVVPVAYALGRELASRRAAIAAAAVVAFNPLLIWYSQEARPYSMLVFLGAVSLLLALRAARSGSQRALAGWAVVSALALLTHYFAAFLFVPEAVWLLRVRPRRATLVAAAAVGAVGAALIPLASYEANHIGTGYITSLPLLRRTGRVLEDFFTGFVVPFQTTKQWVLGAIAGVVAAGGLVLAAVRTDSRERRAAVLLAGFGAAAVAIPFVLAAGGLDYLNTRNALPACVPLLLAVAVGYGALRTPRALGVAGVGTLCALGIANIVVVARDPLLARPSYRPPARALGRARAPRLVAVPPVDGTVTLGYYLDDARPLPAAGAVVAEVDAASLRNPHLGPYAHASVAGAAPRVGGFRLVEARQTQSWAILRYRSTRPLRVSAAQAAAMARPLAPSVQVLYETPGAGRVSPFHARYG